MPQELQELGLDSGCERTGPRLTSLLMRVRNYVCVCVCVCVCMYDCVCVCGGRQEPGNEATLCPAHHNKHTKLDRAALSSIQQTNRVHNQGAPCHALIQTRMGPKVVFTPVAKMGTAIPSRRQSMHAVFEGPRHHMSATSIILSGH